MPGFFPAARSDRFFAYRHDGSAYYIVVMQNGCQLRIEKLTPRALVMIGCLATLAPAFAQDDLRITPARLSLTVRNEPPDELCRRFDPSDASQLATVSLHRTFHDDFDAPPLSTGKWVPHYAGGA